MAITDNKITDQSAYWVKSAPDLLIGTPNDNKNVFDRLSEHIIDKFNSALDDIASVTSEQTDYIGTVRDEMLGEISNIELIGAFTVRGIYATEEDLYDEHPTGEEGDAYLVGDVDDYDLYVWDADLSEWADAGSVTYQKHTAFNRDFENVASNIQMDGTASAGTGYKVARANHVHPTDTSRASQDEVDGIQERLDNLALLIYPVGSIYINVNNIDPANLFGGTWEKLEDTFLVASGTTFQQGTTGGSVSVTFQPNGEVIEHAITIEEMPSHRHRIYYYNANGSSPYAGYQYGNKSYLSDDTVASSLMTAVGGGQPHNHDFQGNDTTIEFKPPYLAVNVWKRTA